MHGLCRHGDTLQGGAGPAPPPLRAPSLCRATVPLTASASFTGLQPTETAPPTARQPPPTAYLTASGAASEVPFAPDASVVVPYAPKCMGTWDAAGCHDATTLLCTHAHVPHSVTARQPDHAGPGSRPRDTREVHVVLEEDHQSGENEVCETAWPPVASPPPPPARGCGAK